MPSGSADVRDKQVRRRHALQRRRGLAADVRAAAERALLTAVEQALDEARDAGGPVGPVAAYASLGTEPGTSALLAALPEVLLPVLLPDGDLDWAPWEGELVAGPRGLQQPPGRRLGPDALAGCSVVVVPALAVDRTGTRLGRGGGSYDRALHRSRGLVVAALHDGELVDHLPAEPHDRPVHAACLPARGLVRLRP